MGKVFVSGNRLQSVASKKIIEEMWRNKFYYDYLRQKKTGGRKELLIKPNIHQEKCN